MQTKNNVKVERAYIREGAIVARVSKDGNTFGIVSFKRNSNKATAEAWSFSTQMLNIQGLVALIQSGVEVLNAGLDKSGKLIWPTGALSRFTQNSMQPVVIISEISRADGSVAGYKIVNNKGAVTNCKVAELIAYCKRAQSNNGNVSAQAIPIQNAQFVAATNDSKEFIRSYPNGEFLREELVVKKNEYASVPATDIKANTKAANKIMELFNDAQIKQLLMGKQSNLAWKIYANPKLSAEQMEVLRETLQDGSNAKLIASEKFSIELMKFYRAELKYNRRIKEIINPVYTPQQAVQLSLGQISGVDISKFSNPKNTAEQMSAIRSRLENHLWDYSVEVLK